MNFTGGYPGDVHNCTPSFNGSHTHQLPTAHLATASIQPTLYARDNWSNDSQVTAAQNPGVGVVVGIATGVAAFLVIAGFGLHYWDKKRRERKQREKESKMLKEFKLGKVAEDTV